MKVFSAIIVLAFVIISTEAFSQVPSKWAHTGVSLVSYKGDLSQYENYTGAFHAGIQFNKKKRLNGAFNLGFGSVTGENRNFEIENQVDKTPNKFFKTTFIYLNYDLHVNLIKKDNFMVYLSQGIGFIRFTPRDQFDEDLLDQPSTRADDETYRNSAVVIPTKIGAMYLLPNYFGVGVEAGFMGTATDYLDNISEFGSKEGNDNILAYRMSFYIPLFAAKAEG